MYDIAIVGGGALGCSSALWLARGGMKVALIERGGLCMEASGRNAGTLPLLYARGPLLPLMVGGKAMWERAPEWLGADVGHRHTPGLEVAFTPAEAALLETEMKLRQEWGLPIEIIGGNRAREIEPGLSDKVVMAGYSPVDGFAGSNLIGGPFRAALTRAGVTLMEGSPVVGIDRRGSGFDLRVGAAGSVTVPAARILLTSNMWVRPMLGWLGLPDLPIKGRSSQVIVTERMRPVLRSILRVISQISLKQTNNGTFLIGSGTGHPWQDDPDSFPVELKPEHCWEKLSIAAHAVPALRETRVMRTWHG
ncbi:FAD-dependent oxidoreductase, partial [Nostoc sp. NIES-2111]